MKVCKKLHIMKPFYTLQDSLMIKEKPVYQVVFYVPETHVEQVKLAMFEAGGGTIGLYSHCSWQVSGEGQFMPLEGSNAYLGSIHQVEKVKELKVEMVCHNDCIQQVIRAMKQAHPYETPAYVVIQCEKFE